MFSSSVKREASPGTGLELVYRVRDPRVPPSQQRYQNAMNASELTIRPVMEETSNQQTPTPDPNPPGGSMLLNTSIAPIAAPKWPRRRDQSLPPMIPDCDILVYRPTTPNGPTFTCTLRGLLRGHLSHVTVPHTEWLDTSTLSYTPLYKDLRATPWLTYNPGRCLSFVQVTVRRLNRYQTVQTVTYITLLTYRLLMNLLLDKSQDSN
jgi:hypothetical protein